MSTVIGPEELLSTQTISNSSVTKMNTTNGKFISGTPDTSGVTSVNSGVSIGQLLRSPITQFLSISLPSDVDVKSVRYTVSVKDADNNPLSSFPDPQTGNNGIRVVNGLSYLLTFGGQMASANGANSPVRQTYESVFPVPSTYNIDGTSGIYGSTLYLTVFIIPVDYTSSHDLIVTYKAYSGKIFIYGKRVKEVIPPASVAKTTPTTTKTPEPTTNTANPETKTIIPTKSTTPTTTSTTPTTDNTPIIPKVADTPTSGTTPGTTPVDKEVPTVVPVAPYIPPADTQVSVRVTDASSIALYGTLLGAEFESEYIENTRQAVRVAEQIIWQANQTITIAFSTPYDPTLRRGDTIQISSSLYAFEDFVLTFTGLVKSISHVFDANSGEVTTQVICRGTEYTFNSVLSASDETERIDGRSRR